MKRNVVKVKARLLTRQSNPGANRNYPSTEHYKTEREYVAQFDKMNHYVPVDYRWVTPTLGNFA